MIFSYICNAVRSPQNEYAIVNQIVHINNLKREIMKIHELEELLFYDALNLFNPILAKSCNVELSGSIHALDECADEYNQLVKEAKEWDIYFANLTEHYPVLCNRH